jgi:hypothetical protein
MGAQRAAGLCIYFGDGRCLGFYIGQCPMFQNIGDGPMNVAPSGEKNKKLDYASILGREPCLGFFVGQLPIFQKYW